MDTSVSRFSLLHIEDDPILADLVKAAFGKFGYSGETVQAASVKEACDFLVARELSREPFDLILTDMNLPDGTGLDVIREVRGIPYWRLTPIVVLSSEMAPGTIDSAYALGANCYVPKMPSSMRVLDSLKALYECWMEGALLPHEHPSSRILNILGRGIAMRTRTAEFYVSLARFFEPSPEDESFWLDRAMYEGNFANLLAFFREKLSGTECPADLMERIENMHSHVREILAAAEKQLRSKSSASHEEVCRWALNIMEALDEEIISDSLGLFFPKEPVATAALKIRASVQLREVATYVLSRTEDTLLRERAEKLLAWSHRLEKA